MLRLGLIGVGHGGTLLQANLPEHETLQMKVTALCDVDEGRMAAAAAAGASGRGLRGRDAPPRGVVILRALDHPRPQRAGLRGSGGADPGGRGPDRR